ncbi:LexA family transcriptional regulator [Reichenbachiella versicolor]|uniref:LexA family transcriptional regulator n=1 Tax=Reichenbachiella versicolor TaxID=1821036 RepID=UPI000D6E8265|nr:LexA family transcriptional regulator [Reichenbachiella versicolor]
MAQKSSKKFSYVGSNIKKIRKVKHISQADFASLFNLARPSVGAYEEGRSEPKLETIISIANHFRISIDILLTRDLTVNEIFSLDQLNKKLDKVHLPNDKNTIESSNEHKSGVPLVKIQDYLNYIVGYQNADFIQGLEHVNVPREFEGVVKCFQMNGSEMEYHQQGLHHGDLLLAKLQSFDEALQKIGEIYVVVHKDHIFTRRLSKVNGNLLQFVADDPHYEIIKVDSEDVLQLWRVKMVMSQYLTRPTILEERVMKLEKRLDEMMKTN